VSSAPHPDQRAASDGPPEGRCASLRGGPRAHPSPAVLQPERSGLRGAHQDVGARPLGWPWTWSPRALASPMSTR